MDTKKRLSRKPVTTAAWIAVLTAMALLLGIGANLCYSARQLPETLDQHHTTMAVQAGEQLSFLEEEDIQKLQELDMVQTVDLRTLTGAYIPELTAQVGLSNWGTLHQQDVDYSNHITNESYNEVVLIGTIEDAWVSQDPEQYRCYFDMSAIGHSQRAEEKTVVASMTIEQVVLANGDYLFFENEQFSQYCGKVYIEGRFLDEGGEDFFQPGQRYIVSGQYDPACYGKGFSNGFSTTAGEHYPWLQLTDRYRLYMGSFREGDALVKFTTNDGVEVLPQGYEYYLVPEELGPTEPAAQRIDGTLEEFLAENPAWAEKLDLFEKVQHTFPVLGTEALDTMYCFLSNSATIVSGRMFTQAEYDAGERVCVINEQAALDAGIAVGDTLTFGQYLCDTNINTNRSIPYTTDDALNNPAVGGSPFPNGFPEEEETFTVVGIYRLEGSWDDSTFSITPNTVFIPQKAQIEGGYGGPSYTEEYLGTVYHLDPETGEEVESEEMLTDWHFNGVYGAYFSIKLKNGSGEAFHQALADAGLSDYYTVLDQGYEAAMESVEAVGDQAEKLLLITAVGWALLLTLYVLLYQGRERTTIGIMRSVGASPAVGRSYLFSGGMALAALGVVLGTLVSGWVTALAENQLSAFLLSGDTMLSLSGGQELTGDAAAQILDLGSMPLPMLLALAAAQLALIAAVLWLHAARTARQTPRKLLGA